MANRVKSCAQCGTDFAPPSDCVSRSAKYCSRKCGWAAQKAAADASLPSAAELRRLHHDDGLSVSGVAKHYGRSDWWAKKALATRGVPERAARPAVWRTCDECGEEFRLRPSKLESGRRFCSKACSSAKDRRPREIVEALAEHLSQERLGAANPNYKHGRAVYGGFRRSQFNLAVKGEDACRNCGSDEYLALHHVIPRSMFRAGINEIRNGVPLCIRCHLGWHRRLVVLTRGIFTSEEWAYLTSVQLTGQNINAWLDDRYPPRPAMEEAA